MAHHLINHPDEYKSGIRVITVARRRKDKDLKDSRQFSEDKLSIFNTLNFNYEDVPVNAKSNEVLYITNGVDDFNNTLGRIMMDLDSDQRVYSTISSRNLRKSIHKFHQYVLDNCLQSGENQLAFFKKIRSRAASAFGKPETQENKLWLFDCDTHEETELVKYELSKVYTGSNEPYWYSTKSGNHCVVSPFNRMNLTNKCRSLLMENSQMLWTYYR